MKRFLLILALWLSIVAGAVAQAAKPNILIITGYADGTIEKEIAAKMKAELSDRYNITEDPTGGITLDGFSQIYDLRITINSNDFPQKWQREAYVKFLNAAKGNSLFMLGGPMSNYNTRGTRINDLITEAGGGPVKDIDNDDPGDPEILKAPFTSGPNNLTTISLGEKGGRAPVSGTGTYLSTRPDGTPGCGLYFAQGTLANAKNGCLVVLYSFSLMRDNDALRANIEHVMAAGGTLLGPTASSISLSVTPSLIARRSKSTFTATVAPDATGTVKFIKDDREVLATQTLVNGVATYEYTSYNLKTTYRIRAQYFGDANYNASNSETVNLVVCGTPMYPTSVSATAGDGQATVSFTPPTDNGGAPIISYTVTASQGGITATGTSSPITVTGLTNGTAYTFKVMASNGPNTSMDSPSLNSVTPMHPSVITWDPADITYGTALGDAQLNATADVPGKFTYSSAAGTVLNAGNNQALTVTFTPTDKGNTTASKAPTINVAKAPLTVTASSSTITKGEAIPKPSVTYSGFVNGEDEKVLDVKPAAINTATNTANAGTYDIIAANGVANNYKFTYVMGKLTINKITPTISWAEPAAITYGTPIGNAQLSATASYKGAAAAGTLAYIANGSPLKAGDILPAGTHSLTVTFVPTDAVNYSSVVATVNLTVNKATPTIAWENPSTITYGTKLVNATVSYNGAAVAGTISYTDNSNALKDDDILTAGAHSLTATFTPTDAANYSSVEKTVSLTVEKATPIITWDTPPTITYSMPVSSPQLSATVSYSGVRVAGTLSYTTEGNALKDGDILPAGEHTLKVIFTPTDAANYSSVEKTTTLTVEKATPGITWENLAAITYGMPVGDAQLNAAAISYNGTTVAGDLSYTINGSPLMAGKILASGSYTLKVTFTPSSESSYIGTEKTVNLTVAKAPLTVTASDRTIVKGEDIPALGITYDGFVNGDTEAVLDTKPTATTTAFQNSNAGTYDIIAEKGTDGNYEFAYVKGTLTISKITPAISWATPASIIYGMPVGSAQLGATASYKGAAAAGTLSYTTDGNALKAGDILTAGEHSLKATFTPSDAVNYSSVEATATLTVEKATPATTWKAPSTITYGTKLSNEQLSATADVEGTFSYTPALGATLTAGEHTLRATFTPTDATNYSSVEVTATLTVDKATPAITWEAPSAITYGTKLGNAQLSATASIEGTFTYAPAAETVLNAGQGQALSVTFTPSDAANYNEATKSVAISVAKAPLTATATSYSIREGEAIPALGITYKGFVNGDTEAELDTRPTATTNATATSPTGVYTITVAGGTDDCYELAYAAGKLTVSNPIVVDALQAPQPACEGDKLSLTYTLASGKPTEYQIVFDAKALAAGFSNSGYEVLPSDNGTVSISIPARVADGTYQAALQLRDGYGNISETAAFQVTVNVSADVIVPKFGNVVLIDNHDGRFTGYQWYRNGSAIGGATNQYYKDPNGLSGTYYAQLKTATGQTVNTCSKALSLKKSAQASVSVYPNPARAGQELTVKLSGFADEELQGAVLSVYSTQGAPVLTSRKVEQENRITLSGTDGVYMGRITTADGQVLTFKVVLAN